MKRLGNHLATQQDEVEEVEKEATVSKRKKSRPSCTLCALGITRFSLVFFFF